MYSVPARLWKGLPDTQVIQWYEVPWERSTVNRTSFLFPRNWDLDEWFDSPLGELETPRVYCKGPAPYPVVAGKRPCGEEQQWREGESSINPPLLWPGSLVPRCCPEPIITVGSPDVLAGKGDGPMTVTIGPNI